MFMRRHNQRQACRGGKRRGSAERADEHESLYQQGLLLLAQIDEMSNALIEDGEDEAGSAFARLLAEERHLLDVLAIDDPIERNAALLNPRWRLPLERVRAHAVDQLAAEEEEDAQRKRAAKRPRQRAEAAIGACDRLLGRL